MYDKILDGLYMKLLALGDDSIVRQSIMGTLTLKRGDYSLRNQERSRFGRTLTQAFWACGQFLGRVDIDSPRNPIKKLSSSMKVPTKELVTERDHIVAEYGRWKVARCILKNKWERFRYNFYLDRSTKPERIGYRFPRERILSLMVLALIAVTTVANAIAPSMVRGAVINLETAANNTPVLTEVIGPVNWLTGEPKLKGSKAAVMGAFNYATEAGYNFAANEAERDRLVADGTLVRLKGKYIRLKNVTEPYVLPVVLTFVNRLGQQYAEQGCGKLVITGAMRNLEHQATLGNGSSHSVHPTGMPVDLERIVPDPESKKEVACYNWLERTLLSIEENRRIDATAENSPRHFHVVVVPNAYNAFLASLPSQIDPEEKLLALALHFEGAGGESSEGYRAIAWTIRNRVRSGEFPNTIVEVVAQGAAGRSNEGCQFSFMCDGKAESVKTLCIKPSEAISHYWLNRCDERFAAVLAIARQVLAEPESADPTGGAVLYYAASMPQAPYWADTDMKSGTVHQIGSHIFGCSNFRGKKACRS